MTAPRPDDVPRGPVGPGLAVVFATTSYLTLVIFGWGMFSLVLDEDVIETPGLGPIPGAVSVALSGGVFAWTLASAVRRRHPSFWSAAWVTAFASATSILGVWVGAVIGGAALGVATGVASRFATTWVIAVIVVAALVCAWGGIALVRTRARRPRWRWEDDDEA